MQLPRTKIKNLRTRDEYLLLQADQLPVSRELLNAITRICNEPDIFKLFEARFLGRAYTHSDAEWFVNWARAGWRDQTHFVFFVTDLSQQIVAALDIKSSDKVSAEIGYWCSYEHRGLTGQALEEICNWGFAEGFEEFFARPIHEKSQRTLQSQGFRRQDNGFDAEGPFGRWVRRKAA